VGIGLAPLSLNKAYHSLKQFLDAAGFAGVPCAKTPIDRKLNRITTIDFISYWLISAK
jgi:hypothetical protein